MTAIEMGDLDRGYGAIDISGKDERLYSLTCQGHRARPVARLAERADCEVRRV